VQGTQLHLRLHSAWRTTCERRCLRFTFCPGRKSKDKQSKKFYKVLHIQCPHPVPAPKCASAQKHAAHTPASLSGCDCYAAFHWEDPNSLPENALSTHETCHGTHLKISQPASRITRGEEWCKAKPGHKHASCPAFTAPGLLGFSICFKLDVLLTACGSNSLYGINPLEITFAFSS